jgi:hypothetical protein
LLVGKREEKISKERGREKKEEPSRKKGRQARSSRPNAIMDIGSIQREEKKRS